LGIGVGLESRNRRGYGVTDKGGHDMRTRHEVPQQSGMEQTDKEEINQKKYSEKYNDSQKEVRCARRLAARKDS